MRALVEACTDTPPGYTGGPKPPWRARKQAYLDHLRHADALRVALADNARARAADLTAPGPVVWDRFNAGPEEQRWLLCILADTFAARGLQSRAAQEFSRLVKVLMS